MLQCDSSHSKLEIVDSSLSHFTHFSTLTSARPSKLYASLRPEVPNYHDIYLGLPGKAYALLDNSLLILGIRYGKRLVLGRQFLVEREWGNQVTSFGESDR